VPRLSEDHRRARELAAGLAALPGIQVAPDPPPSNMVYLSLGEALPFQAEEVSIRLREKNILVGVVAPRQFRLVTHYWVDDAAIRQVIAAFGEVLQTGS